MKLRTEQLVAAAIFAAPAPKDSAALDQLLAKATGVAPAPYTFDDAMAFAADLVPVIRAMRREAGLVGNLAMVGTCDRALRGDGPALDKCIMAIGYAARLRQN